MSDVQNVIIIGSGPAGLTAALYTSRAELKPMLFEGVEPGGQLALTTDVENYPGFPDGIMGPELMESMRKQAARFGTELRAEDVKEVDFSERPFTVRTSKESFQARSVIISTGASAKMLGLESERKLLGHGVSSCATCDGFFFKNKRVFVVGGGDTAMEESLFLTKFAERVTIVHRRDELRASKVMQQRARNHPKIDFMWNSEVIDVLGDEGRVTGLRLKDTNTGKETEEDCDGLFLAIGHKPNTAMFEGQLDMTSLGYVITHEGTKTNVPGVFAAGDVQDHIYRQAVTAAGTGCMAAIDAERFLAEQAALGDEGTVEPTKMTTAH